MSVSHENTTIPICQLENKHFVVEDYQRGYKWTVQQVLDLLEDISSFDSESDAFYCLQPLALVESDISAGEYEVIDGQQRLTTIFIILSLMDKPLYEISYKTRAGSKEFLNSIADLSKQALVELTPEAGTIDSFESEVGQLWGNYLESVPDRDSIDNTDNYHFFMAAQTILSWQTHNKGKCENLIENLLNYTHFIWYLEPREKEAKVVFRNLNSGKIPLTNAELIKADFINKHKNSNPEIQNLLQNELANDWDLIEQALYDDQFWYFINNDTNLDRYETRIDLLLELLLGAKPKNSEDKLYIYHQFLQKLAKSDNAKESLDWDDVKLCFYKLREWYEDHELYHLIGYLVDRRIKTIRQIFLESDDCGKLDFKKKLVKYIKDDFSNLCKDSEETFLSLLHYEKSYGMTLKTLLLYNIEIYQTSNAHYRFPFDKFKGQKWSLEHIHAQKTEEFTSLLELQDWVIDMKSLKESFEDVEAVNDEAMFSEDKLQEIEKKLKVLIENSKLEIPQELKQEVSAMEEEMTDYFQMHGVSNMVLLDGATNSSFSNHPFPKKRDLLIEIDRRAWSDKGDNKKVFIPIATKNVFLKQTSQSIGQLSIWGAQDRMDYFKHIEGTLKSYLPEREFANA